MNVPALTVRQIWSELAVALVLLLYCDICSPWSLVSPLVLFHNMINAPRMSVKLCTQWHAMAKGGLFQNSIRRSSPLPLGLQQT